PASASLGQEQRIRHLGAGHSDHVSRSLLDDLLCHAEVNDAANNEDLSAVANDCPSALCEGNHVSVSDPHRRNRPMERVVTAARDVEEIKQTSGGEDFELLLALLRRNAALPHELIKR